MSSEWWCHYHVSVFFLLVLLSAGSIASYKSSSIDYDEEFQIDSSTRSHRNNSPTLKLYEENPRDFGVKFSESTSSAYLSDRPFTDQDVDILSQKLDEKCGLNNGQVGAYISDGMIPKPYDFPSFVYLEQELSDQFDTLSCGGTILDELHVLSAASCYNLSYPPSSLKVKPFHSIHRHEQEFHAVSICRGSDAVTQDNKKSVNFMVVELHRPLKFFSWRLGSACLPKEEMEFDGEVAYQLGRGWTSLETQELASSLRAWKVKRAKCTFEYHNEGNMCLINHDEIAYTNTCYGDTGSGAIGFSKPLRKHTVVGVLVSDYNPCQTNTTMVAEAIDVHANRRKILELMLKCSKERYPSYPDVPDKDAPDKDAPIDSIIGFN